MPIVSFRLEGDTEVSHAKRANKYAVQRMIGRESKRRGNSEEGRERIKERERRWRLDSRYMCAVSALACHVHRVEFVRPNLFAS